MADATFAVTTATYSADDHKALDAQCQRQMHYKAAATYAAKVITNQDNYVFHGTGFPDWLVRPTIRGAGGVELIDMSMFGSIRTFTDFLSNDYGAAMYVVAAMQNAIAEVKAFGDEMLTPSEVESMLGLKSGVVRKHIFDHPEIEQDGLIRRADGRTWLVKRGYALAKWGKHGTRIYRDMLEHQVVLKHNQLASEVWVQLEALEYAPKTKTAYGEYSRTETRAVAGVYAYIERVDRGDYHQYKVVTWHDGAAVREEDMVVWQRDGATMFSLSHDSMFGGKLRALAAFGVIATE